MTTDFAKRLKEARSHAGLTQEQLADAADMSQSAIGDLESKRHGSRRTATLASVCGVSALWLESGEGPMSADAAARQRQLPQGMRQYPVLSFTQARARCEGADAAEGTEEPLGIEVASDNASPQAFFVRLDDLSMSPEFRPGDCLLVDPQRQPQPGDCVLATHGPQTLLRKYRLRGTDARGQEVFELVPLNEDYPVLCSEKQALGVAGVVVEWVRRG